MQIVKNTNLTRKSITRKKIMLGGLIVKAELDYFYPNDPATLYGMLLYSKELLRLKPELKDKWKTLGVELISDTKY